jgi:(p)ppGpp synthase/HD superfamily hydrolase
MPHAAAHAKRLLVLREQLQGRSYAEPEFKDAQVALEFARKIHVKFRKDGVTPEFDHQVSIALYALTLPELMFPAATICAILLHDTPEDYDYSLHEIGSIFRFPAVRDMSCTAVDCLTKVFRGIKRDETALFAAMAENPIASIAKPCDRIHNQNTMPGVFSAAKMAEQLDETERLILPMTKIARRNFPHQRAAFDNVRFMLKSQIGIIRNMLPEEAAAA